jgi:hypothetical protein
MTRMKSAWVVVRATLDFSSEGRYFQRDEMATVDAENERVKGYLRSGWLEPIPAAEQPVIEVDEETGDPKLVEETPPDDAAADSSA